MNRTLLMGSLVMLATGCMHEQASPSAARAHEQKQAAAAQAAQTAAQQQSQQQVIDQQRAEIERYRSMLTQGAQAQAGAIAPAGRQFSVKLDQPINSKTHTGDAISAHLTGPIFGPSGVMIAPEGALLTGRVVTAQHGTAPVVELSFQSVQTVDGKMVPLHATVSDQQPSKRFDAEPADTGANGRYDAALYPRGSAPQAIGGGPTEGSTQVRKASKASSVYAPSGTELSLVLTAPLGRSQQPPQQRQPQQQQPQQQQPQQQP